MNRAKICGSKFKKAQHIVELALLAPFIMFFLGIVYNIAITIHTNYKFNASLYEAIGFMASTNKLNSTKEETAEHIKQYTGILLGQRHAPYRNSLEVKLIETGDIDFLIGLYKYTSSFRIFNGIANFNPDDYNYLTMIPINNAVLKRNSFEIPDSFFDDSYNIEIYKNNPIKKQTALRRINNTEKYNIEIPEVQF